jgi:hypothetical protein
MSNRVNHQKIVGRLLEGKAVDFAAIGEVVAELGPSLSMADEPWEVFCGTMRYFVRVLVVNPRAGGVEDLANLRGAAGELNT